MGLGVSGPRDLKKFSCDSKTPSNQNCLVATGSYLLMMTMMWWWRGWWWRRQPKALIIWAVTVTGQSPKTSVFPKRPAQSLLCSMTSTATRRQTLFRGPFLEVLYEPIFVCKADILGTWPGTSWISRMLTATNRITLHSHRPEYTLNQLSPALLEKENLLPGTKDPKIRLSASRMLTKCSGCSLDRRLLVTPTPKKHRPYYIRMIVTRSQFRVV